MTPGRVEGRDWVVDRSGFDLPIVLAELPREVPFGFLGRVLAVPGAFRMRMQLHRVPRGRSLDLLEGAGSVAEAELSERKPSATARTAELELEAESARELSRRVASGTEELFRVGLSLHSDGASLARAERGRGARPEALGPRFPQPRAIVRGR